MYPGRINHHQAKTFHKYLCNVIVQEHIVTDYHCINVTTKVLESGISYFKLNTEIPYYLLGYKVIDKEIELIENRHKKDQILSLDSYNKIIEEVNFIKSNLLSNRLENYLDIIKNTDETKWVDYDLFFLRINSLNNTKLPIIRAILLGLVFSVFYVFVERVIKSSRISRKNK